jgi:hypothetical protein
MAEPKTKTDMKRNDKREKMRENRRNGRNGRMLKKLLAGRLSPFSANDDDTSNGIPADLNFGNAILDAKTGLRGCHMFAHLCTT